MSNEEFQRISRWVPVAFGLIGFLIGFVAGLSLTPVVGTLLPLLFGVIGGGTGFFAAQKPAYSQAIGQSVAVLACLCLLGVVYGIHLRQGLSWRCAVSACTAPTLDLPQDVTDKSALLNLFSIKTALLVMDADEGDKQRIFNIAVKDARTGTGTQALLELSDLEESIIEIAERQAKLKGPVAEEKRPVLKKK